MAEYTSLAGVEPGTFIYFRGQKAFRCALATEPRSVAVAVYAEAANRFECQTFGPDGEPPTCMPMSGKGVLECLEDSMRSVAAMTETSGPELYYRGPITVTAKPRLVLFQDLGWVSRYERLDGDCGSWREP